MHALVAAKKSMHVATFLKYRMRQAESPCYLLPSNAVCAGIIAGGGITPLKLDFRVMILLG